MEPQTRSENVVDATLRAAARARRHYRDLDGPRALPIVGNLHQVDKMAMHRSLEEFARRYGPVCRFRVGPAPAVVVSDAALVRQLLRDRPQVVGRSPWLSSIMRELGLTGVFTAEGDDWRRQRLLMTRTFTPELFGRFYPTASMMVQRLMARWSRSVQDGRTIDFARDLKAFTMDVTVAFAMGEDVNALESAIPARENDRCHAAHDARPSGHSRARMRPHRVSGARVAPVVDRYRYQLSATPRSPTLWTAVLINPSDDASSMYFRR
jgi:cytochrome P450